MEFTKETTLKQILEAGQEKEAVLHEFGVPCVTCPFAKVEMDKLTIGDICSMYHLDLEGILKKLNQ